MLDKAEAERLIAEAIEDARGFAGRFYFAPEDEHCPDRIIYEYDGDETCVSDSLDQHIAEPIARMLNRHRAMAEQLRAAMGEREHWRLHAKMMARAADTEKGECEVLLAQLAEARAELESLRARPWERLLEQPFVVEEIARLRAENERMRALVDAARAVRHAWRGSPAAHSYQRDARDELCAALDAIDAALAAKDE